LVDAEVQVEVLLPFQYVGYNLPTFVKDVPHPDRYDISVPVLQDGCCSMELLSYLATLLLTV
jgi:hypothetical protein